MPTTAEPTGARVRSLAEVKAEVLRRTGKTSPFNHVRPDDVQRIVASLTSLDPDHWAAAWCKVGLDYEAQGDARAKAGASGKELADSYFLASDYCRIGRYPVANSPGKKQAHAHSVRMFRKAAKHFEHPLQIVELPFRDKTLVGYLTIPNGLTRPPVVMHWGGVDGWKEDREAQNRILHRAGLATLTLDMPGAGEHPLLYGDPAAIETFSAWLDHLVARSDVDGSRIAVWGGSFGAYWAARLAYVEPRRIRGAVFQGGNVHVGFQREWLVPAFTTGGATYLFGAASLLEARSQAMGTKTMDEFIDAVGKLSLKDMGLLDQPSAPILGVNGKLDDQAPVADIYLLMEHGAPKEARIYPDGHHMGRTPGMPEDAIFTMIATWLKGKLMR
jgi:pimeloyl-ACP methyl ester carboxylesterase